MKPLSDVCCCVIDHGLFFAVAERLARDVGRQLYWAPSDSAFPNINERILGDGYPGVQRIVDFWDFLNEIDLFVFPDATEVGLQLHLESLGYAVWGSRSGAYLENRRRAFTKIQEQLGMSTPERHFVRGVSALSDFLRRRGDEPCFIKVSRWRNLMETWKHSHWEFSEIKLDTLAHKLGPLKESVTFIIEEPIEAEVEVGYDGICVDGQFADTIQGYEAKGRGFLAAATKYQDLPEQVREINDKLALVMRGRRYRNFFSSEIRVAENGNFLIDPCCRCPWPGTASQLELYANFGEVVWAGAQGELVQPEMTGKFVAETILQHDEEKEEWRTLIIPDELRQWVKLRFPCHVDGLDATPPLPWSSDNIGSVIGIGDTAEEAIDQLKEHSSQLSEASPGVLTQTEVLADLLKEIQEAEEEGLKFSNEPIPAPATVIEDA